MRRLSLGFALLIFASGAVLRAAPRLVLSEFTYERAPYPSCHASTLAETAAGTLVAAWFGGTAERNPDVCIYFSRRVSQAWTPARKVADGVQSASLRYPCWNPVLFQPRSGPLLLFYKVGPAPEAWWGMVASSSDDGLTWTPPRRLPPGILGPVKDKPVQLSDGTLLCGSSTESPTQGWRLHMEFTSDLGRTWRATGPLNRSSEFNAIQPAFLTHADGRLQLLCRTREGVVATAWSSDRGHTWSRLAPSGLFAPNSGIDAVTLADGRQLVVYNYRSGPGRSSARWPLSVALSPDGVRWSLVLTLEDRPLRDGYAYPAVIQTRDGLIHISYTWNRERIKHVVLDGLR